MKPAALLPPIGSCAPVTEALPVPTVRFRLQFLNDRRTKELRWVLFASSQRGAIGKLIFTLEKDRAAHVKSIVVHKDFRGLGLARVLYLATLATVEEKHVKRLYLEAEEDSARYGRLVGLYRGWGFAEIPNAQVCFLYNGNDSLRKVPMMSVVELTTFLPIGLHEKTWFCMIALQTPDGSCLVAGEDGAIKVRLKGYGCRWQTLLGSEGKVFLRSAHGKFLCVEEDGTVLANRRLNSTWETFQIVPHHGENASQVAGGVALRSFHGGYLGINALAQRAEVVDHPLPWDGGDLMALVCNKETPYPLFVKIMRKYQTLAFVTQQVAKYGDLQHARLSILEACKCVMTLTGDSDKASSWVLKYMLVTAAAVKQDGHPDWLQLVVFLRALGLMFLCWTDDDNAALRSISAQEWMTKNSTWVIGERIPSSIDFPELNELNSDHCNSKTSDRTTGNQGGLEHVQLPWTPDEYLYHVLSLNKTTLPIESLAIIRFWSFKTWNTQDCFEHTETKDWIESLSKVAAVSDHVVQKVDVNAELPHYTQLAKKYLPNELHW